MKGSIRYIFTNAIIILMMVFVCLPCSVKREVKQALNIPVASLEHSEKPNKTIVCHTFTKGKTQKVSVSCQNKDIQKPYYTFDFAFYQNNLLQHNRLPFSETNLSALVPIYILHEQYLI
ncbi:hypothetical protein [Flavobacterium sp. FlaQc-28]|uniref:hypothetical protein n=1 Tax=Flavobacterium sp. FlaQc-28 TaxID=3374178 RepID=UPI0037573455